MRRRSLLALGCGLSLSGCLQFEQNEQSENERNLTQKEQSLDKKKSKIKDIELITLREFEEEEDMFAPFKYNGRFGSIIEKNNKIVLYSGDGSVIWESVENEHFPRGIISSTPGQYYTSFEIDEKKHIRAFDKESGEKLWTTDLFTDDGFGEISFFGEKIYYLTKPHQSNIDNQIKIGSISSGGQKLWSSKMNKKIFSPGMIVYKNNIYVAIWNTLYKLNASSGKIINKYDIAPSDITKGSENIYSVRDHNLKKFSMEEDEIEWSRDNSRSMRSHSLIRNEVIVTLSEAGWMDAYATKDGEHLWETRLETEPYTYSVEGNIVWIISHNSNLYAYDVFTGSNIYQDTSGENYEMVVNDDRIIVRHSDMKTMYKIKKLYKDQD